MKFLETLLRLHTAVKQQSLSEVIQACSAVSEHNNVQGHDLIHPEYSDALQAALKRGDIEIFAQVCGVECFARAKFDFNETREIIETLRTNDSNDARRIFLAFLNQCGLEVQTRFVYAAFIKQYHALMDQIRTEPGHVSLRGALASAAVEFDYIEFALEIVQSTPEALPPLSACNPHTRKGDLWIALHNKYAAWRAQQEHDALTAEVAGLDKHTTARKM